MSIVITNSRTEFPHTGRLKEYTVHPGGDPHKKYAGLEFRPGNRHDETLRHKTFSFPDKRRLSQERLSKDRGLEPTVRYLQEAGMENLELLTLHYNTEDGPGTIQIIYAEPSSDAKSRGVDVFLHGRNASIGYLSQAAIRSYISGKAICMLSYRGEEANKGTPYQEALADDLDASIEFLNKHKEWETKQINFVASSLGCDILTNMFYRRHKLYERTKEKFGDVTMIAPFSSLRDIAKVSIGRYRIVPRKIEPKTPGLLYPIRSLVAKLFKNPLMSLYDNLPFLATKVKSVKILASRKDEYIPISQSRKVYRLLKHIMGESVSMKEFSDLAHSELCQKYGLTHCDTE